MNKYLTKSLFQLALECKTKLYYTSNPIYANNKKDNSFLEALAEGGFQVGALARCYFPNGVLIAEKEYKKSLAKTNKLLKQENVTIFEAAIRYQNLFIRVDILRKRGNLINLIEVKAKSYTKSEDKDFLNKKGNKLNTDWKPYLYDVAFQKHVISQAFPEYTVKSNLMLVNRDAVTSVDGLNQKFMLVKRGNDTEVKINGDVSLEALGDSILIQVPTDYCVDMIWEGKDNLLSSLRKFPEWIEYFAEKYVKGEKMPSHLTAKACSKCEFQATAEQEASGLKSGFKECWKNQLKITDKELDQPNIFEIWNFKKKQSLMDSDIYFLHQVEKSDINPRTSSKPGLSTTQRQWLQVEKTKNNDDSIYFDTVGFNAEMRKWNWPLHFIDFETSAVAIPFTKGRKPYDGIAFQFSHHIMYKDGKIVHFDQYLNTEIGSFPNFDFVRNLKKSLENDKGSIFRYATHENTYLNIIYDQLKHSNESDLDELCDWIRTITKSKKNYVEKWKGDRNMVDMLELVKKYYYNPMMKGSNSIKGVLPAVLNSSVYLQNKYRKPVYGKSNEIKSLNFDNDWIWIEKDKQGKVINPYKLLPALFDDIDQDELDSFTTESKLADGGAAMTAYAKMQFTEMSNIERNHIIDGLLKYCELDTLAMVMIMEEWINLS